ncbi:Chromate transport protein [Hyella patelloides LEGE 07179]|uniref:Chromate transport protein n=1 Tax=Hyella patelloides LEGE 07179 TaxID=945734 RepID=A0A563VTB4_9CYAN|nr:chromate efflux transporter [Hyella patelloides]VEP14624.1 Chromate transport protein [Hyella patelloides LEGE 07179]
MKELAFLFLKLGIIGFGGPQAHIAAIGDEAVTRRNWLDQEQFSEGIAICEMLPGPASTQMAIYTGYLRSGQLGALVAGICFIFPAFLIVLALSWAYFHWQTLPQTKALFLGISPVVTAIILGFCWKLSRKVISNKLGIAIAIITLALMLFSNINVLILFLLAGLFHLLSDRFYSSNFWFPLIPLSLDTTLATSNLTFSSFWGTERIQEFFFPLLSFFFQVGSFIFGGGLVIIPLLEFEVVEKLNWLTKTEFLNGVAIGQISPGPVVLTAAFVGYKVAGFFGAITATVSIFTPSFLFIMIATPLLQKIRNYPQVKSFLKGVTPAVLGAIAAAAIPLAQTALIQETIAQSIEVTVIFILALIGLINYKITPWKLILVGSLLGLGFSLL